MSTRVEAAYRGSVAAFRNPMLDLLHGRQAPFVVTALSLVFTAERPTVPVADVHAEVGDVLDQLREAGVGSDEDDADLPLPAGSARELCRQWVRAGWLLPQIDGETEVYRLSAHAVGALEIAGRAGGNRARVSRSRVRTLLDAVEHLAQDADPDLGVTIARLADEIRERQEEIERLESGGDVERVDDERLLEEAENVLHLVRELPADFARVAESIKAMQRDVVTDLRQDVRPTGDVLREYLQRGRDVMEATPEGRAFSGALRLIGDPHRIDDLATQLRTVLRQGFARQLEPAQRLELAAVSRRIELGVQEVLVAQRQASHVITTQVRTHDPARDRQVDDLLRDVMAGLQQWMPSSRRGDPVDPLRRLPVIETGHLRQNLADVNPPQPPAPLPTGGADAEFTGGSDRGWGGPAYARLAEHLAAFGAGADEVDVAAAFEAAAADLRRPVDLLGLIELAFAHGLVATGEVAAVEAVRPDGTRRRFAFEGVLMRADGSTEEDEIDG